MLEGATDTRILDVFWDASITDPSTQSRNPLGVIIQTVGVILIQAANLDAGQEAIQEVVPVERVAEGTVTATKNIQW